MKNRLGIIYKATCLVTGKAYIGQTIQSLNIRKYKHISDSNNITGPLTNTKFSRALRKYGKSNFVWEIIQSNIPAEQLNGTEIKLIAEHDSYNNGYNSSIGGGSNKGWKCSEDTKKKISQANKGKKRTTEERNRISKALKGKPKPPMSDETRKRIANAKTGDKNPMYGKTISEETRQKKSESAKKAIAEGRLAVPYNPPKGADSHASKLTWKEVNEIRKKYVPYKYSIEKLSNEYGICSSSIWDIVNYVTWKV